MRCDERSFETWDGERLHYRMWTPEGVGRPPHRGLLLFHRGHEHGDRWRETAEALALDDTAVFAWDQRGHGRSPGARGSATNLAVIIKDADCFARHIQREHGVAMEDMAVLAHSVGAVIAAAWVHDYAPPIRAMILAAPAFRVKLYVPLAIPALRLRQRLLGSGFVKSYVKARMLTRDAEQARAYNDDPLIFRQIAINILLDLHDTSTRILDDAGAITTPTLVLTAGDDWVVKQSPQWRFYRDLSSLTRQMQTFPTMRHAMFHERDRTALIDRVRRFLLECFETPEPPQRPNAACADRGGHTRSEFDRLRTPPSLRWRIVRRLMRSFGRLSDGIRLGWREGFDSGVMLDYIYRHKPSGTAGLGRVIDDRYLNSVGWKGIRQRRAHLEVMLREAIAHTRTDNRPVRILDIASGPGRYVLETLKSLNDPAISALLRDYKDANIQAARALAAEFGLPNVVVEHGDAFDESRLAALQPRPTIAIVSGLYELFPENEPIRRSLRGLSAAMDSGARLIYTCQPWHPQVEFIARVLVNREGQPWIMRRRTQEEMDALVREAGFIKESQSIDQWGIFTVSTARRP